MKYPICLGIWSLGLTSILSGQVTSSPNQKITAISAGLVHTLALQSDGTVLAWGSNHEGQLGDGTTTSGSVEDGGGRWEPAQVNGLSEVVAIAAGWSHSLALKLDGTVWEWGSEGGCCIDFWVQRVTARLVPAQVMGTSEITAIAAGGGHSLALRRDDTVWTWGGIARAPVQVSDLTDVIAIAAGGHHSLALKADGTVWAWGDNRLGQLGDGDMGGYRVMPAQVSGVSDVIKLGAGGHHSVAIKKGGAVFAWGYHAIGVGAARATQVSVPTPVRLNSIPEAVAVAAGELSTLAVDASGTVWAWGWAPGVFEPWGDWTPSVEELESSQVTGIDSVTAIAVGGTLAFGAPGHCLALRDDGTLWAWGANDYGQLGIGTYEYQPKPVQVPAGSSR